MCAVIMNAFPKGSYSDSQAVHTNTALILTHQPQHI